MLYDQGSWRSYAAGPGVIEEISNYVRANTHTLHAQAQSPMEAFSCATVTKMLGAAVLTEAPGQTSVSPTIAAVRRSRYRWSFHVCLGYPFIINLGRQHFLFASHFIGKLSETKCIVQCTAGESCLELENDRGPGSSTFPSTSPCSSYFGSTEPFNVGI